MALLFHLGYQTFAVSLNMLLLTFLVALRCKKKLRRMRRGRAAAAAAAAASAMRCRRQESPPPLPPRHWRSDEPNPSPALSARHPTLPSQPPPAPPPPPPLVRDTAVSSTADPKLRMPPIFLSQLLEQQHNFEKKRNERKITQQDSGVNAQRAKIEKKNNQRMRRLCLRNAMMSIFTTNRLIVLQTRLNALLISNIMNQLRR